MTLYGWYTVCNLAFVSTTGPVVSAIGHILAVLDGTRGRYGEGEEEDDKEEKHKEEEDDEEAFYALVYQCIIATKTHTLKEVALEGTMCRPPGYYICDAKCDTHLHSPSF